tara:strand:+ start:559 stop:711 length:153 start_codon:yes stop_codon:yes gene_type:complete
MNKILSIRGVNPDVHTRLKVFAAEENVSQGEALELALTYAKKYQEIKEKI